jgi:thioredoxin-related protein
MKPLFAFILFLFLSFQSLAINFGSYSVSESLEKAKLEHKKVYVFYSALWCMPCEIMKEGVFKDPEINAIINETMIPVMVYYDESIPSEWMQRFEVKCLPTNLILEEDGSVSSRFEGGMSTQKFRAFLKNESWTEVPSINYNNQNIYTNNSIAATEVSNTEGKIYLDGVLVSAFANVQLESEESRKLNVINEDFKANDDGSTFKYVIQYGAFNTLEKIKLHQKNIRSKLTEETIIIVDSSTNTLPFKLVSKNRFSEDSVELAVKSTKSRGLDCFPRAL